MKFWLLFLGFILCQSSSAQSDYRAIDPLLDSMDVRIRNCETPEPNIAKAYEKVLSAINEGEIGLRYDSTLNYGFRQCASASVLQSGMWVLSYGDFVLDLHNQFPLLAEAIIMHEFQHLYDGITKPDMLRTKENPIENTYYELDGVFIEGLYISYYSLPKDRRSKLDRYFAYDLQNGMESIALIFTNVDITLLHQLDEVRSFAKSEAEAVELIAAQGDTIFSRLNRTDSEWLDFQHGIAALTYTSHIRQLVHDIKLEFTKENLTDSEVALTLYPSIHDAFNKINKKMVDENYLGSDGLLINYVNSLIEQFEAELLSE